MSFCSRGDAGHSQAARRAGGGTQHVVRPGSVGSRPAEEELAVVAARSRQQRRRLQPSMACECRLEVLACVVAPARDCGGSPEQALYGAGVPGEAPLDKSLGVGGEFDVQAGGAVGIAELGRGLAQRRSWP